MALREALSRVVTSLRALLVASLLFAACDAPTPARTPDAAVDRVEVDVAPAERELPPSPKALADLAGFSLPYRDLPTASDAASVARRRWALRTVRAMGLRRIRREIFWTDVEPTQGSLRFDAYDAIVQECADAQIELLGVLAYGNPWASSAPGADAYFPPDDPATFARFAAATVRRYRDRVRDWEIWNEPNAGFRFWRPNLRGDPAAFGALVDAARTAIAVEDPAARVAYGGTVFLPQVLTGGVDFARESFDANRGLSRALTAFAMHAYTLYPPRSSPERDAWPEVAHTRKVAQMAAMLDAEGFSLERPIWISEMGWAVTTTVTEALQAAWLVRAVLLSALAGVDGVWIYQLGDGPSANDLVPEDRFGIFRYDANTGDAIDPVEKPSATALRVLFTRFGRYRVTGREALAGAPSDVYALALRDPDGRRALAVWRAEDDAGPWRWTPPAGSTTTDARGDAVTVGAEGVTVTGAPVFVAM